LLIVGNAGGLTRSLPRFSEDRKENGRKNSDDSDDDEQFDEGKSGGAFHRNLYGAGNERKMKRCLHDEGLSFGVFIYFTQFTLLHS
jgi:hypothetical protein